MANDPIDYSNPDDVARLFEEEDRSQAAAPPPQPQRPGFGRLGWRLTIGLSLLVLLVGAFLFWSVVSSINNQPPPMAGLVAEKSEVPSTPASTDKDAIQKAKDDAARAQKENSDRAASEAIGNKGAAVAESDDDDVDKSDMTKAQKDRLAGRHPGTTSGGANTAAQRAEEARKRREAVLNSSPIAVDNSAWFDENGNLKKPAVATTQQSSPVPDTRSGDVQPSGDINRLRAAQASEMTKLGAAQERQEGQGSAGESTGPPSQVTPNQIRMTQQPGATQAAYVNNLTAENGEPLYRVRSPYFLNCTIKNRINGAMAGPIICELSEAIWSESRQKLLAPVGSLLVGEVAAVGQVHQERLFAAFHRMILPNGGIVDLDTFKGLSIAGESGLSDKVNRHLVSMFAGAAAIAAIGAVASVGNTINSFEYTFSNQYRQQLTSQIGQVGMQLLSRFINRLPTIILRQNFEGKVFVASDLLFFAYDPDRHVQ